MTDRDESPLSAAQQRLWFQWQLRPGGAEYNVPMAYRLRGVVEADVLRWAVNELVARHDILRARFPAPTGAPELHLESPGDVPWHFEDLRDVPEVDRAVQKAAARPFDLATGPVLRTHLFQVGADEYIFLLVIHHIVVDGWSLGLIAPELAELYRARVNGLAPALPAPAPRYADYIAAERESPGQASAMDYWRGQLAGASEQLRMPMNPQNSGLPSYRGGVNTFTLPGEVRDLVLALSRRHRTSRFVVLLAAYAALLFRLTGSSDVIVGVPVSGRAGPGTQRTVGLFVNTLPIRVRVDPDSTFAGLLHQVRDTFLAGHDQNVPLQQLIEALTPARTGARHPFFQVTFGYSEEAPDSFELPGVSTQPVDVSSGTSKFELTLMLEWHSGHTLGRIGYQTDIYDADTVALIADRYQALTAAALSEPDRRLSGLPLTTAAERSFLLTNSSKPPMANAEQVHVLTGRQAEAHPDAIAVNDGDISLSYRELDESAERLAAAMAASPGDVVAVCLPRGAQLVISALGVLKAGAVYLPLDPDHPDTRLAAILDECRPVAVITDAANSGRIAGPPVLTVPLPAGEPTSPTPDRAVADDAPAYIIYTSGSTGRPKGVVVGHASLANLAAWHRATFGTSPGDRVTMCLAPGFDASVWEIWSALSSGATIEVPTKATLLSPSELQDWLLRRQITDACLPTALAERLLTIDWPAGTPLRRLMTGGDRLRTPAPAGTPFAMVNLYGPAESTVTALCGQSPPGGSAQPTPIGSPIAGIRALVLDEELQLTPIGAVGELHLGGTGLAFGYLGRPDATADRFVPDPYGGPGERMYRTGDLVRVRQDGVMEFVGRNDAQVKIRGFRIELGEIEAALREHPAVTEAVVKAEGGDRELRLTAWIVLAGGIRQPTLRGLREYLQRVLPRDMVPARYLVVSGFSTTINGKTDRDVSAAVSHEIVEEHVTVNAPATSMEQMIAAVWGEVLGLDAITVDDSFFELGGHSLQLVQVRDRLGERLARPVSIVTLYEHPTIAALAAQLTGPRRQSPPISPPPRAGLSRLGSVRALRNGRQPTKE
jgi:amino acid adenylation domain-containing protein